MRRAQRHILITACLIVGIPGCVEDFGRIRESDVPRIGSDRQKIEAASKVQNTPERFNARALWEEYGGDVPQADLQCKGKFLQVTGIVRCISSDDKARPYIGFQVFDPSTIPASRLRVMKGKEKSWHQDGFPPLVLCYFDPGERSQLESEYKGQSVQITGRCLGRVKDPSGFKDYIVVLDSCRIAHE
jgi:hypothetical protein